MHRIKVPIYIVCVKHWSIHSKQYYFEKIYYSSNTIFVNISGYYRDTEIKCTGLNASFSRNENLEASTWLIRSLPDTTYGGVRRSSRKEVYLSEVKEIGLNKTSYYLNFRFSGDLNRKLHHSVGLMTGKDKNN